MRAEGGRRSLSGSFNSFSLSGKICGSHQWQNFSLACLQSWTPMYFPLVILQAAFWHLVRREDLLQVNKSWAKYFHLILPWTLAGQLHLSCSETLGINLHETVYMHTESKQCSWKKQGPQQKDRLESLGQFWFNTLYYFRSIHTVSH